MLTTNKFRIKKFVDDVDMFGRKSSKKQLLSPEETLETSPDMAMGELLVYIRSQNVLDLRFFLSVHPKVVDQLKGQIQFQFFGSPVHMAILGRASECIRVLAKEFGTILDSRMECNHKELFKKSFLKKYPDFLTPLAYAVLAKEKDMVRLLLDLGADVDAHSTINGVLRKPMDLVDEKSVEIRDLLLEARDRVSGGSVSPLDQESLLPEITRQIKWKDEAEKELASAIQIRDNIQKKTEEYDRDRIQVDHDAGKNRRDTAALLKEFRESIAAVEAESLKTQKFLEERAKELEEKYMIEVKTLQDVHGFRNDQELEILKKKVKDVNDLVGALKLVDPKSPKEPLIKL